MSPTTRVTPDPSRPDIARRRVHFAPLRNAPIHGIIGIPPDPGPDVSHAVYTAIILTSARMAAGMTSRARRPYIGHSAG